MKKKDAPSSPLGRPRESVPATPEGARITSEQIMPNAPHDSTPALADDELKRLMRQALDHDQGVSVDVLGGVQKRLRERSGGKFYKDGWSTSRHPPFATYFITALLMLATVVLVYAMIVPVVPDPVPPLSTSAQDGSVNSGTSKQR